MSDLIDRQAAVSIPALPKEYREYQTMNLDDAYELGWYDLQRCIEKMPSAQLEQPTVVQDILQYLDEYLHPIISPEHWSVYSELYDMVSMLPSAQPTIEPGWIPCSKRLPNENDYNSCMECLDGAVWYFTENGAMGLGYYYESTKEWATTDDLKTDGKVVAWMPLPEPWKGE